MNAMDYLFHYVHHKDLTVGLGNEKELKEKVIHCIQHSTKEERWGFGEIMLCKQMMLDKWLDKFGAPDGQVDELVVYVLSQMLREPIAIITKTCFWSSVKGGSKYIGRHKHSVCIQWWGMLHTIRKDHSQRSRYLSLY